MGTLYDVLQVSPEASPAIIKAAYEQLSSAVRSNDPDSEIQKKVLDEAFFTLGNTEKRQRYDQRLASQITVMEAKSSSPRTKYILIVALICAGAFGYMRHAQNQENARIERERIAAEVRKAELQAKLEEQAQRAETERLRLEKQAEQQQRQAFEAAKRESDYTMRANAAALERARREADTQQLTARQIEQREAQRRVDRDKAYLRQLERENARNRRGYY